MSDLKYFSVADILAMEKQYRTNLINSAPGVKGVYLIGTKSGAGQMNLAIFNSVFHVGANPPYLGMIIRPDSVDRHTWQNILNTGFYTINQVSEAVVKQAHQTSARYESEVSEFEAVGLAAEERNGFIAPYVKDSAVAFGLKLAEFHRIEANGTIIVIGEVQHMYVQEQALQEDGFVALENVNAIGCVGLDAYYKIAPLGRLPYAKKDKNPDWIN